MRGVKKLAGAVALAGMLQAQAAAAQECVKEADIASLYVYAVPHAIEAVQNSCQGQLKRDGYLAKNGGALAARYAVRQGANWPGAKRALLVFADSKAKPAKNAKPSRGSSFDDLQILDKLPDDVVRPLADALFVQLIAQEVKPQNCRGIERMMSALAPVEPDDAGVIVATIVSLAGVKEPQVCPSV